jgi:hypothetical protein
MTPQRKTLTSFFLAGTLAVGGAACGSDSDSSDSNSSADSVAAWCNTWEEFEATEDEADLEDLTGMLDILAKDAPAEIKDDMEYLASAFTDSMEAMESMDTEAMEAIEEKYSEEEIDAVSARLEAYVQDVCGIDTE